MSITPQAPRFPPDVGHTAGMNFLVILALLGGLLIPPPPPATWMWPTEGPQVILRDFQAPATPWGVGHRGLDLGATGSTLRAPLNGVISFSGDVAGRGVLTITGQAGERVSLEPVTTELTQGDHVTTGETIAKLQSGHCAELCLHLGLRIGERYRSSRAELGVLQRAVLLPWAP